MSPGALFLDLDHTLFDPETVPIAFFEPAMRALREANDRTGGIPAERLAESMAELARKPASLVAVEYGWPDHLRLAWLAASAELGMPWALSPYPDVSVVVGMPHRKFLVTTGVPSVQRAKVEALGFRSWLDGVHVDDVTAEFRRGKQAVFAEIMEAESLDPDAVLVIGDRLESEIAAGSALGLRTVHVARRGCFPGCPATHCVADLTCIPDIA